MREKSQQVTCIKNLLKDSLLMKSFEQLVDTNAYGRNTPEFEEGLSKIFYTSPADKTCF